MSKLKGGGAHGPSADHGPAPLALSVGAEADQWALSSLDADTAYFKSVCFSGGPSDPCNDCVVASDWTTSCSLD